MGEVEQLRMSAPGAGTVDTLSFTADEGLERTLRRDVAQAERNLERYLARKAIAFTTKLGSPGHKDQPEDGR